MKSYTAQAMREPDRRTIAEGFASGIELMEQAGYGLFRAVMRFADSIFMPDFLLLAGKGNNGGDVFVLARYMAEAHVRFRLCMSCAPDELSGDALEAFRRMPAGTFGKKTADGLQVRKIVAGGIFTPQKNVAESIIHLAFRYGLLRIAHIGIARIILKRFTNAREWEDYWLNKMNCVGDVVINIGNYKCFSQNLGQ